MAERSTIDFLSLVKNRTEKGHDETTETAPQAQESETQKSRKVPATRSPERMSEGEIEAFAQSLILHHFEGVSAYQELYPEASLKMSQERARELLNSDQLADQLKNMYSVVSDSDEENKKFFARQFYNFLLADITDYYEWQETITYDRYANGRIKKHPPGHPKAGKRVEIVTRELVLKDITSLPKWMRQNIKSIEVIPTRNGQKTKLVLYDRQRAVSLAAKFAKVFDEYGNLGDGAASIDEFTRILEAAAARAEKARRPRTVDGTTTFDGSLEQ